MPEGMGRWSLHPRQMWSDLGLANVDSGLLRHSWGGRCRDLAGGESPAVEAVPAVLAVGLGLPHSDLEPGESGLEPACSGPGRACVDRGRACRGVDLACPELGQGSDESGPAELVW